MGTKTTLNKPSSNEAIALGCTYPVVDNNHGKGINLGNKESPLCLVNDKCPLHSKSPEKDLRPKQFQGKYNSRHYAYKSTVALPKSEFRIVC